MQDQLDGLTAGLVGRARFRRVTWASISSILRISEDTARHRYTDRHILRHLTRFNRSATRLTSLATLFSSPAPQHTSPDNPPAADSTDDSTDTLERGDTGPTQTSHPAPPGGAYNRLSPILSMLIRTAQLTNKEVSSRIGCSPSYLSRFLSGERVPTWNMTRSFALVCGADPEILRTVWESEKLRQRGGDPLASVPDTPVLPAADRLRAAIRTLHLRAGRPAAIDIAAASNRVLSSAAVASLLEAADLPHPGALETFVRVLGGNSDHFMDLLQDACDEAAQGTAFLHASAQPAS
ncbi:helix-turn-helix domain-containing protein [Streptomyces griseofuscus]|uniref:helix-turn-helix domain-containing protein n=1 Tax=Streptomyces griseofuscus TaxID=146922 RepID=UPI00379288C4